MDQGQSGMERMLEQGQCNYKCNQILFCMVCINVWQWKCILKCMFTCRNVFWKKDVLLKMSSLVCLCTLAMQCWFEKVIGSFSWVYSCLFLLLRCYVVVFLCCGQLVCLVFLVCYVVVGYVCLLCYVVVDDAYVWVMYNKIV